MCTLCIYLYIRYLYFHRRNYVYRTHHILLHDIVFNRIYVKLYVKNIITHCFSSSPTVPAMTRVSRGGTLHRRNISKVSIPIKHLASDPWI